MIEFPNLIVGEHFYLEAEWKDMSYVKLLNGPVYPLKRLKNRNHRKFKHTGKPGVYQVFRIPREPGLSRTSGNFEKGILEKGWNNYSHINLKFKNQIVCTKE